MKYRVIETRGWYTIQIKRLFGKWQDDYGMPSRGSRHKQRMIDRANGFYGKHYPNKKQPFTVVYEKHKGYDYKGDDHD